MGAQLLHGVEILTAEGRERCEVEIAAAGAYAIAITTVIERPVTARLVSSYVIALDAHAAATHLWRGTGARAFHHRELCVQGVAYGRACLLDHLAELQQLLADEARPVRVEISEQALAAAAEIWNAPGPR